MFFVDKYSPQTIEDAEFHKKELQRLEIMSKDDSIPHIIFYGPEGSGKQTVIRLFLEMIYNKQINNITESNYAITGSGSSTQYINIKQSNYHIIIEPSNTNFDRYLIQDVVKEYARKIPLNVFTCNKLFKTVLINNIDNMSYYAQTSLRRTMEKYSGTCRFIMWGRSLSKVIDPLRSRCVCFKIKSPKNSDLFKMMTEISFKENIKLKLEDYYEILRKGEKNIKKILWLLEMNKYGEDYDIIYDVVINDIVKLIMSLELKNSYSIRDILYKIMITNITGTKIIIDIINELLKKKIIPFECKVKIAEIGAKYEHNLIRGRREIIHLEAFINSIMYVLNEYKKLILK